MSNLKFQNNNEKCTSTSDAALGAVGSLMEWM